MNQPLISVLHPTRRVVPSEAFPQGWRAAFDAWLSACDDPSRIEYVIAVHESRWERFWEAGLLSVPVLHMAVQSSRMIVNYGSGRPAVCTVVVVKNTGRDCAVDQLNAAAAASSGLLLCGTHDDLFPPERWDTLALGACNWWTKVHPGEFSDGQRREYVIRCGSGSPSDATLTIAGFMSRARYERLGYMLHPDFDGVFSDNYFDWELRRDQQAGLVTVLERQDIQFEHRHPIFGKGQVDEHYAAQNRPEAYQDGEIIFKRLTGSRMIAVALPGQDFSSQWVHGWTALYGHLMARLNFLTLPVFAYTSNVHCTRMDIVRVLMESRHKVSLVLWIDDDNKLSPEQFDMLLADLDENPQLSGVVGWCWCDPADPLGDKNEPYVMSCGSQSGWDENRQEQMKGLGSAMFTLAEFERYFSAGKRGYSNPYLVGSDDLFPNAFWSGFPVVLMRREVLEQLGWESFLPMVRPDVRFGFTTEDTTFFYRAHQAGLKFAVDIRCKVPHLKLRAIEAQYFPESEREKIEAAKGNRVTVALEGACSAAAD